MLKAEEVAAAARRIAPHVLRTPLLRSRPLGALTGAEVLLKLESEQTTGSFKLRGATHKVITATEADRARGFVTASSGNHGLAMAEALSALGLRGTVVLPTHAAPAKRAALAQYAPALEVLMHGTDCVDAETHARQLAAATGRVFVSPYNDIAYIRPSQTSPHHRGPSLTWVPLDVSRPLPPPRPIRVMAGQGSVAVELLEQAPAVLDAVFVTVGGGGLIGGMATWIKHARPGCRVVGCQPAASAVMHASVRAGHIVDVPSDPTLADGSAGTSHTCIHIYT
jgi:threonine dehydratase